MEPHPRIRKTVKWGGAVVSVVLLVVWVGSGWIGYWRWNADWSDVHLQHGMIRLHWPKRSDGLKSGPTTIWPRSYFSLDFRPHWTERFANWDVAIPLWIPLGASLAVSAFAWRLDTLARRRVGFCSKCGYNLTGLVGGAGAVCPECGSAAPVVGAAS